MFIEREIYIYIYIYTYIHTYCMIMCMCLYIYIYIYIGLDGRLEVARRLGEADPRPLRPGPAPPGNLYNYITNVFMLYLIMC